MTSGGHVCNQPAEPRRSKLDWRVSLLPLQTTLHHDYMYITSWCLLKKGSVSNCPSSNQLQANWAHRVVTFLRCEAKLCYELPAGIDLPWASG